MIFLIKFVLSILPSGLLKRIQEYYISKTTMIFSNVPGPRDKRYMQGIQIDHLFGFVPLVGNQQTGFVLFSYGGGIMLSMMCNRKSMKHPRYFTECFMEEFKEFKAWTDKILVEKGGIEKIDEAREKRGRRTTRPDAISMGQYGEAEGEMEEQQEDDIEFGEMQVIEEVEEEGSHSGRK